MTADILPFAPEPGTLTALRASEAIESHLAQLMDRNIGDGAKCRMIAAVLATVEDAVHRAAREGRFDHDTTYDAIDDVVPGLAEMRERLRTAASVSTEEYRRPAEGYGR